mmetsp:Transcript_58181/g.71122  ORF Transcript_58181/g.71122 Transcript_58181/m.71122 type:complete len:448 (+) Transcript_58181:42-1385(+)
MMSKTGTKEMMINKEPKDRFNVNVLHALILGIGSLLGYNLIISSVDYFLAAFPNHSQLSFLLSPMHTLPDLLCLTLLIPFGGKFSYTFQIISGFVLTSLLFALVPVFIELCIEDTAFIYILIVFGIDGVLTSVLTVSVRAYYNYLPKKYVTANVSGQAIAGIVASLLRVLTKLIEPDGKNGFIQGGRIYFISGAIFCLICIISYVWTNSTELVKHYFNKSLYITRKELKIGHRHSVINSHSKHLIDVNEVINKTANNIGSINSVSKEILNCNDIPVSYWDVFLKIKSLLVAVFTIHFVTFLVFPGLLVGLNSEYQILRNDGWFSVIIILEFNVFDYIGRHFIANYSSFGLNKNNLWIASLVRILLYPIFLAMYLNMFPVKDWMAHIATGLLGVTHGFIVCICFQTQPTIVNPNEQHIAAAITTLTLVIGITTGSYTTLGISKFLKKL